MSSKKLIYRMIQTALLLIIIFSFISASAPWLVNAETGCLTVTKEWYLRNKLDDSLAPAEVIVDVFDAQSNELVGIIYLSQETDWENSLCGLEVGKEYYVQERAVSSFNSFYNNGNSVVISAENPENNIIEIRNEYKYPPQTFTLSIYNVINDGNSFIITVTICADQNAGMAEDFYLNDEENINTPLAGPKIVQIANKGDCERITFEVDINEQLLDTVLYVGHSSPDRWIEIGELSEFIPVGISKISDLNFGSFTANNGTLTVLPDGSLEKGPGYTGYHEGGHNPAEISVSWIPNAEYNITFSNQITITNNSDEMTVMAFESNYIDDIGSLDLNGNDSFYIGGTVEVKDNLAPGNYSGQFFVTVSFE